MQKYWHPIDFVLNIYISNSALLNQYNISIYFQALHKNYIRDSFQIWWRLLGFNAETEASFTLFVLLSVWKHLDVGM